MSNILFISGIILLAAWTLGVFMFQLGGIINILPPIVILALYKSQQYKKASSQ